jgi:hypothetical protein
MIHWPEKFDVPAAVQAQIDRLRVTDSVRDCEASPENWYFENLSWTAAPIRVRLRSERREPKEWTMRVDGTWLEDSRGR